VHRFIVADGCHWRDVRETATNVGAALSHAMRVGAEGGSRTRRPFGQ
jgi:hypothetical protein